MHTDYFIFFTFAAAALKTKCNVFIYSSILNNFVLTGRWGHVVPNKQNIVTDILRKFGQYFLHLVVLHYDNNQIIKIILFKIFNCLHMINCCMKLTRVPNNQTLSGNCFSPGASCQKCDIVISAAQLVCNFTADDTCSKNQYFHLFFFFHKMDIAMYVMYNG